MQNRRQFLQQMGAVAGAAVMSPELFANTPNKLWFEISLAEWSLHKTIFNEKKLTNLDFPVVARKEFGIGIVEYVNQMFRDKAKDTTYLNELLKRCKDNDVKNHLIMVDGEGGLAETDANTRNKAVENHKKWVECAKYLGCATIRVNSFGKGTAEEVGKAAVDGLGKLGEFAAKVGINVIVENHGGYSSDGKWLSGVMRQINMKNVGTLPDFGNFCVKRSGGGEWGGTCIEEYDRYLGTQELMTFAKGVSAKTNDFDANGNEAKMDYARLLKIVKDTGFRGIVGIEYEGNNLSEYEGIKATKKLLERVGPTV
jgi:sugar phosphate isomerase/epimerase